MDEREALKRQIDLLQNLINNHRSIHGDAPSCSGQQWHPARPPARGRSPSSFFSPAFSSRGGPQPTRHWRKSFTLSSKTSSSQHSRHTTQTAKPSLEQQGRPIKITKPSLDSAAPNSSTGFLSLHAADTLQSSQSSKEPARGEKDGTKCATSRDLTGPRGQQYALTGGVRSSMTGTGSGSTAIEAETEPGKGRTGLGGKDGLGVSELKGPGPPEDQHIETKHNIQAKTEGKSIGLGLSLMVTAPGQMDLSGIPSSAKMTTTATRVQNTAQLHIKHCVTGKTNTAAKQVVAKATSNSNPTPSDANSLPLPLPPPLSAPPSASLSPRSKLTPAQPASSPHSKFSWVKSHQPGGVRPSQARIESRPPENLITSVITTVSHSGVPSSFSSSPSSSRKAFAPRKKVPRRLSLYTAVPKTSKYTWVSSSAGAQARLSRKPLSPKDLALALPQRATEGLVAKKPKSQNLLAKQRKAAGASSSTTLSSRYCWKAGPGGGGQTGSGTGSRSGSLFRWTSEKENGAKGGSSVPPSVTQRTASSSPGGFKLRSRMKIIRRSVSSGSGAERRPSPAAMTLISRYSLRLRTHIPVRTQTAVRTCTLVQSPGGVKRSPSLELVSFGRHKLRRLSPNPSRTGPASLSLHSQLSQRVFRTRYKIVTRLGGATSYTPHYSSHALSWRAKRIHTARSVLQSRLRPPGSNAGHPPAQYWRGRGLGMRWIGGNLYSVSANKLSRTVTTSAPINRTVRLSSPQEVSHTTSSTFIRPSSTRFVASRAVQRSLAIIRHARQKKSQKQYCMYYNRFGKCNRGNTCPYIHDPDKVAVCTRFLRGTCKQTGGTCPFSHKVAKEKMPVCSYFLKGICNNGSCPYSHVYVSRKAALCQDFIRGYCPQGEKCKKKHTLVCPDFSSGGSCPRGAQCKLQHRQRAKRTAPNPNPTTGPSAAPAKKSRTKRPSLSVVLPVDQAAEGSAQADPGTLSSSSLGPHKTKLPSFISLSSSPEDTDAPDTPPADRAEVTERILQIKPRL